MSILYLIVVFLTLTSTLLHRKSDCVSTIVFSTEKFLLDECMYSTAYLRDSILNSLTSFIL